MTGVLYLLTGRLLAAAGLQGLQIGVEARQTKFIIIQQRQGSLPYKKSKKCYFARFIRLFANDSIFFLIRIPKVKTFLKLVSIVKHLLRLKMSPSVEVLLIQIRGVQQSGPAWFRIDDTDFSTSLNFSLFLNRSIMV